ncbi:unnamed protein product [Rangifer tarandus platyrhynchus]|uniref:Uncharacterized protein n=1 Tax=Rangifer tarandus platyrhynchus TaxID=3082113 RepID=A0AC59Y6H0_RANTA
MGVQVRDLAGGRGKGGHAPCGSRGTNDAGQGDLDCVGGWTPRCLSFPSTTSGRSQETRQRARRAPAHSPIALRLSPRSPPPPNLMEEAPLWALPPSPLKASPPVRASRRSIGMALDPYSRVNCSGCRGSFFPEL